MKDMTQLEQRLAQPKPGPKEYEKIWKKKKNVFCPFCLSLFIYFVYFKFITAI